MPGTSLADVAYNGEIIPALSTTIPTAPTHLPTSSYSTYASMDALPSDDTHRVRISLDYNDDGSFEISKLVRVDDIASGRIYVTTEERSPLWYPQIKIWSDLTGTPDVTEPANGFGTSEALTIKVEHFDAGTTGTSSADRTLIKTIQAGQVASVSLNVRQTSTFSLRQLEDDFSQLPYTTGNGFDEAAFNERFLNLLSSRYNYRFDQSLQAIAGLTRTLAVHPYVMSGFVVSNEGAVQVEGLQVDAIPDNLHIDVMNPVFRMLPIDGIDTFNSDKAEQRMYLFGYQASYLESYVTEELTNVEAVSAARAFQVLEAGSGMGHRVLKYEKIGVNTYYEHRGENSHTEDDVRSWMYNYNQETRNKVIDLLDTGYVVSLAVKLITVNEWTGPVYMKAKTSVNDFEFASLIGEDSQFLHGGTVATDTATPISATTANVEPIITYAGERVNLANGNLFRDDVDIALTNIGVPVTFRRHYDSESTDDWGMGVGWKYSFGDRLVDRTVNGDDYKVWVTSSGTEHRFLKTGTNSWDVPSSLPGASFEKVGTDYVVTEKNGLKRFFDASGKLATIDDRNGNRLRIVYQVDDGNFYTRVRDNSSGTAVTRLELIDFDYANNPGIDTVRVEEDSSREWTFSYIANGGKNYLSQVDSPSDAETATRTYEYEYYLPGSTPSWNTFASGLMARVTKPDGRQQDFYYHSNRRVSAIEDAEGHRTSFSYDTFHNVTYFVDENGVETAYHFDEYGRILRQTNADRSRTLQEWDPEAPHLLSVTDAVGEEESYVYDAIGNLTYHTSRDDLVTKYEYDPTKFYQLDKVIRNPGVDERVTDYGLDAKGNVESISQTIESVDPNSPTPVTLTTTMTYTSNGLLETLTEPKGTGYTTTYTYNARGQVHTITQPDPDGAGSALAPVTTFTYDSRGNLETATDPTGIVTAHTYDLLNRRLSTSLPDPDGAGPLGTLLSTFSYNPASELVAVTDANGNTTRNRYDQRGRLLETRFEDGTSQFREYDAVGNAVLTRDELGRENYLVYDDRNRSVISVRPDGTFVSVDYDGAGRIAVSRDANGNETSYTYDKVGRVKTITDAQGEEIVNGYDTYGNVTSITDRRGKVTVYEYDELNRVVETRGPEGFVTTTDYDVNSNVVETTRYDVTDLPTIPENPRSIADTTLYRTTVIEYDRLNRPVTWTNPDGGEREVVYNAAGRMTYSIDELGRSTNYVYDAIGRQYLTRLPDPDSTDGDPTRPETKSIFDGVGNVLAVIKVVSSDPAKNQVTQFEYDVRNRQTHTEDAEGGEWQAVFDVAGQKIATIDALGRIVRSEYDQLGRLIRQTLPDPDAAGSQSSPVVTWTYDAVGNRLSSTDPLGRTTTYEYDSLNRLVTMTLPKDDAAHASVVTSFDYDENGNRRTAIETYGATDGSETRTTTWTYDGQGRMKTETLPDPDGAGGVLPAPSTEFRYNALGNLVEVEDHLGRITKHEYDLLNRRESTTLPDPDPNDAVVENPTTVWTYDEVGNVKTVTVYEDGAATRLTEFDYDDLNRLRRQTLPEPDADGVDDRPITEYEYDLAGNLLTLREKREDGTFRETTYEYDKLNRRTLVTLPDPDGTDPLPAPTTTFRYDTVGNQTEVEDHLGRITVSTYDALNRLVERKLPDPDLTDGVSRQPTTQWVYDEAGRLLELKELKEDDTFLVTSFIYDGWDRLLTETLPDPDPNDATNENPVTTWDYDLSRMRSVTDTLGRTTSYEYDALNRVTKEILPDPDGAGAGSLLAPFTITRYDSAGNVTEFEDHLGRLTVYEYDDLNRLITETLPEPDNDGIDDRPITQWTFDLIGNVKTVTDTLGRITVYDYDDLDRLTKETLPEPDDDGVDDRPITEWKYDRLGNVVEVIDAHGEITSREYDDLDRLTKETLPDPDGTEPDIAPETVYVYDAAGNLYSEANQLGETTIYAYDRLDRLTTTTDPRSYTTTYGYDILGRQTSLTDAEGNVTTFVYDDLDRLETETNELNDTRTYEYDLLGRLESLTDRNGRHTRYYYDKLDRPTIEVWWTAPGGTFVDSISTTYDNAGLVASHSNNSGSFSYTYLYDDLDRLMFRTEAGSPSITWTYTYDKAGNLTQRDDTTGFTNVYTIDDLDRVSALTQTLSGGGKKVAYEYNKLGQVTKLTRYEDLAETITNSITVTDYDDTHRISVIFHKSGSGALLRRYSYKYDSASRLTRVEDLSGAYETHDYNNSGQLTDSYYSYQTNENYTYDGTGNRTNTGYVTGDNNQTTNDGTYTYEYDDEGNRTKKTTNSSGHYVEYEWDHRNRLTRVEFRSSGGTLTKAVEYDYDQADRRIAKRVDDNADSTWDSEERFVYDGEDLTMVYDETGGGSGTLDSRYFHGPGIDTVLALYQPGVPKTRWTFTDRLGNVRDVVEMSGSTVSVVEHQNYNSFGGVTTDTNPGYEFRFGFTGRLWDSDIGLQFNRARWYDPTLGKFLSEDPLSFAAGDINLTLYVGGDPVNFTDPSGLFLDEISDFFVDIGESIGQAYDDSEEWLEDQWQNSEVRAGVYVVAAVVTSIILQRYDLIPVWITLKTTLATSAGAVYVSVNGADAGGGSPNDTVTRAQNEDSGGTTIPIDSPLYGNLDDGDTSIHQLTALDNIFNPAPPNSFGGGLYSNEPAPFLTQDTILDASWGSTYWNTPLSPDEPPEEYFTSFVGLDDTVADHRNINPTLRSPTETTAPANSNPHNIGKTIFKSVVAVGRASHDSSNRPLKYHNMVSNSALVDPAGAVLNFMRQTGYGNEAGWIERYVLYGPEADPAYYVDGEYQGPLYGTLPNLRGFKKPPTVRSAKGVGGKFRESGWTYRIDTNNVQAGEGGFHIHVYQSGKEAAKVTGHGKYVTTHSNQTLRKPSEIPKTVRNDVNRLVEHAQKKME